WQIRGNGRRDIQIETRSASSLVQIDPRKKGCRGTCVRRERFFPASVVHRNKLLRRPAHCRTRIAMTHPAAGERPRLRRNKAAKESATPECLPRYSIHIGDGRDSSRSCPSEAARPNRAAPALRFLRQYAQQAKFCRIP